MLTALEGEIETIDATVMGRTNGSRVEILLETEASMTFHNEELVHGLEI